MADKCVTVPLLFKSFDALDTAMHAETARNHSAVAARLEILRISPYHVLLMRWGEACAYAKKNKVPWMLGKLQGESVERWMAAVKRLLGEEALVQEQGWLAGHQGSTVACDAE
jgi:hypothetical protein